jgi:hypothetical protein
MRKTVKKEMNHNWENKKKGKFKESAREDVS